MSRFAGLRRRLLPDAAAQAGDLHGQLECLNSVLAIQTTLHSQTDVRGVVNAVLEHARELQPCDAVAVAVGGAQTRQLDVFMSSSGALERATATLAAEDDAFFSAAGHGASPAIVFGAAQRVPAFLEPLAATGVGSAVVLPLVARAQRCGLLALGWQGAPQLRSDRLAYLEGFTEAAAIALTNARIAEQKEILANYDSLTGLPNRRIFFDRLAQTLAAAERLGHLAAACFIDLDNFKRVNDTLGHSAGDRVLRQVARRLASGLRQGDSVCRAPLVPALSGGPGALPQPGVASEQVSRLGGDEFAVLLGKIGEAHDAGIVARRVSAIFDAPFAIDGREVFLSCSIGIAVFPLDGGNAEELLRNADTAMYCAKKRGRNGFQYYTKSMNAEASRRLHIESRLRSALERDEFEVWYQLQRDARSGELTGAEALVRWDDPEMGLVSPAEFVPLAEETGCIAAIGERVLRSVCSRIRDWRERGLAPPRIAVNLSANQLHREEFPDLVASILAETGVSPDELELEITESAVIEDDASALRTLTALRQMGIQLTLDDFGTGYSSLSHLRRLPLQRIKIDRSFVRELPDNLDDCSLTRAIVAMAQGLHLEVVAEGVETEAQARFLTEAGCHQLQGFLLGRPAPAEHFEELLRREKLEDEA